MSMYSESYAKILNGYNKISACIESTETQEQLTCITNMVESWVSLADKYCTAVYRDKTNKNRRKDSNALGEVCVGMFEDLKGQYQERLQGFTPEEYEATFTPKRIKGLAEIAHECDE